MAQPWTFGKKIGGGFVAVLTLTVIIGLVGVVGVRDVVSSKDRVINGNSRVLIEAQYLTSAIERKFAALRRFFFAGDERMVDQMRAAELDIRNRIAALRDLDQTVEARRLLDAVAQAEADQQAPIDHLFAMRKANAANDALIRAFDEEAAPKRDEIEAVVKTFVAREERLLDEATAQSSRAATRAVTLLGVIAALAVLLGGLLAAALTRALTRQVGSSVGKVQSSSTELQASAAQQATSAKEQATSMNEIATTITELLATSRQISDSAQRVTQLAQQGATAARAGESTVERGNEAITGTRRQIDLVVGHMLDLGKKSQQIGAVLDIVAELAEQTNILAINATIEAAGAGEAGRRFAVVAEEIRKLADRVGGSTKEIRGLIDDVRGAVNTTVMTTETGSKAVDTTSKQFGDVATAFRHIASLVATTLEAAREIELSTKQQTTAVEQVNLAIANVSQSTREMEATSAQTLQTAGALTSMSHELLRVVQTNA
ncbi:MAG TPA: methyl-accepting chemotaxis protein [Polyangia bacterium]